MNKTQKMAACVAGAFLGLIAVVAAPLIGWGWFTLWCPREIHNMNDLPAVLSATFLAVTLLVVGVGTVMFSAGIFTDLLKQGTSP